MHLLNLKITMLTKVIKSNAFLRIITACIITLLFVSIFFYYPPRAFSLLLSVILSIIVTIEWKRIFPKSSFLCWSLLPFYPIIPFLLLILLNESPTYRILLLYLFLIVFSFDSGSYITGKIYGKHKIIPSISPGKTWEGFFGGYIITTCIIFIITKNNISLPYSCLLNLMICTLAFIGDIFESYLKRLANIKDSGYLLPGHGGFLDRFDGIIFVSYFFYFYKDNLITFLL